MSWRDRVGEAPPLVLGLVSAVLFGGVTLLVQVSLGLAHDNWVGAIAAAVSGLVYGLFMGFFIARQRKRFGGRNTAIALQRAVKAKRLPDDADPAVWKPLVDRRARQSRMLGRVGPIEFGLFAALGVYLALSDIEHSWFWWVDAVGMAAFAVAIPFWSRREVGRLAQLRRQLDARPASEQFLRE